MHAKKWPNKWKSNEQKIKNKTICHGWSKPTLMTHLLSPFMAIKVIWPVGLVNIWTRRPFDSRQSSNWWSPSIYSPHLTVAPLRRASALASVLKRSTKRSGASFKLCSKSSWPPSINQISRKPPHFGGGGTSEKSLKKKKKKETCQWPFACFNSHYLSFFFFYSILSLNRTPSQQSGEWAAYGT